MRNEQRRSRKKRVRSLAFAYAALYESLLAGYYLEGHGPDFFFWPRKILSLKRVFTV